VNRPTKEELLRLTKEFPMSTLGKMFGVSDVAVKKWCKSYDIDLGNMRGHWMKLKSSKRLTNTESKV
jgi:hypothetical protein